MTSTKPLLPSRYLAGGMERAVGSRARCWGTLLLTTAPSAGDWHAQAKHHEGSLNLCARSWKGVCEGTCREREWEAALRLEPAAWRGVMDGAELDWAQKYLVLRKENLSLKRIYFSC